MLCVRLCNLLHLFVVEHSHFAPIYSAYAKKVQTVARNLNAVIDAEKEEDGIQPYRVSFAAVDCPQVNPACDRQKVKAFPTIVGFNFNDETNTGNLFAI